MSLSGLRILVTGGTGTFGRAFIRYALDHGAARVNTLSTCGHRIAALLQDIQDPRLDCWTGNVRDLDRMREAMQSHPDLVIHAAAMKRIEQCEADPEEAKKTNVDGTLHVVKAAREADVPRVLVISSDKATSPETCYGKTKAAAEELALGQNALRGRHGTRISVVRYGNVLGSSGSVFERWLEARRTGGPVLVTDPEASRFWWRIDQAVAFVADVADRMQGAEIWIPKLGAATVGEFARKVAPTSPMQIIGMRGTEKQHEAMIAPAEVPYTWELPDAYVLLPKLGQWWSGGIPEGAVKVPPDFRYTSDLHLHAVEVIEAQEAHSCASPS